MPLSLLFWGKSMTWAKLRIQMVDVVFWASECYLLTLEIFEEHLSCPMMDTDPHPRLAPSYPISWPPPLNHVPHLTAGTQLAVTEFFLLGLSEDPELQPILFGLFLSMYLITVLGNLLIILAVTSDPHLHTPMYFFFSILSFDDICFTSTTVPKVLVNLQTRSKAISYPECLTQVYFFIIFLGMDNFLLTVMAYDRFVAICHPLNYTVIMNPQLCVFLVLISWLVISLISLMHILLMKPLSFLKGTEIPHFFCELTALLNGATSSTFVNNVVTYITTALFGAIPATGILWSYSQILCSLSKMSSIASKSKAFSTCGSHLSVVCLFYGTSLGVYLSSAVSYAPQESMISSVMYTVVTPMLNPFIYSLRNKEVKGVLGRLLSRAAFHS
ncbi:olfactory receptor 7D4-like [Thomomys bottae]